MFKDVLKLIKKILFTIVLVAVIVFLVKIIIEGKYVPFLSNFAQFLLNKLSAALSSLKNWLIK